MFYSSINTDFAAYETKVAFGLTKRQIICFVLAAICAFPVYFFTKDFIGTDIAGILMVIIMVPFFLLAMYKKNGQSLETVIKNYVKEQYLKDKIRPVTKTPKITGNENRDNTKDRKRLSAAESVPFKRLYENGICYLGNSKYSIMLELTDINYHQLDDSDQKDFWSMWCMFLNTFDSKCSYQFGFYNRRSDTGAMYERLMIKPKRKTDRSHKKVIDEMNEDIKKHLKSGNKGLEKKMFLIITYSADQRNAFSKALEYCERVRNDLNDKLGIDSRMLSGYERAHYLFYMLNPSDEKMSLNFNSMQNGNLNEKQQIINHSFAFGKRPDRFMIGNRHYLSAGLYICASQLSDRFLTKLLDGPNEMIASIHIEPVNRQIALRSVKRLVSDLQKQVIDEQRDASNRGYSMANVSAPLRADLEAAEKTLSGLTQNDEKMFMVCITFVFMADSVLKLEKNYSDIRAMASEENCELVKLEHQQEDGFFSTLPIGVNSLNIRRQLTTTSLGMFLPFKIKELVQYGDSLCFGTNRITGNIIAADVKTLANPNTLILGTPGRGKSTEVKLLILQTYFKLEDDILIQDPEGEYGPVVKILNGVEIVLSQAGKVYINLFDIDPDCDWDADPISDKSQLLMAVYELILGEGKGEANDKSIIDRCIRRIYSDFVESKDVKDIPTLEDFYNELSRQQGERAAYLKEAIEVYVHGSLNFFNHKTNVDLSNRVISFNLKELGDQLKSIAMLIVQETVWNRVAANRDKKKYTRYICDEFHLLLSRAQTAQYSKEIYKRFRKWGGIPMGVTQNVSDLLDSSAAQSIFYNTDCYILLGQSSGDADRLSQALKLSEDQYKCLLTRNKGEGLLIFGDTILPFVNRIDEDTLTYRLITTKLLEAGQT